RRLIDGRHQADELPGRLLAEDVQRPRAVLAAAPREQRLRLAHARRVAAGVRGRNAVHVAERVGLFAGSQNLAPGVCGQLMPAAQATSPVYLGPGVTNSDTGDTAVNGHRPPLPSRPRTGAARSAASGAAAPRCSTVVVLCPAPWNCAQWAQFMPSTESVGFDSPPRQSTSVTPTPFPSCVRPPWPEGKACCAGR